MRSGGAGSWSTGDVQGVLSGDRTRWFSALGTKGVADSIVLARTVEAGSDRSTVSGGVHSGAGGSERRCRRGTARNRRWSAEPGGPTPFSWTVYCWGECPMELGKVERFGIGRRGPDAAVTAGPQPRAYSGEVADQRARGRVESAGALRSSIGRLHEARRGFSVFDEL